MDDTNKYTMALAVLCGVLIIGLFYVYDKGYQAGCRETEKELSSEITTVEEEDNYDPYDINNYELDYQAIYDRGFSRGYDIGYDKGYEDAK